MSPGARTMPAAMVLPTAAAMPNHIPRILRRPPWERAWAVPRLGAAEPGGGVSAVVLDASIVLDNGSQGGCFDAAMIVAVRKNASRKAGCARKGRDLGRQSCSCLGRASLAPVDKRAGSDGRVG